MTIKNKRLPIRRNLKLISWFNLFVEMRFYNVIGILFFAQVAGSYSLAMTVVTAEFWACSLFEVPTGMLSDKIGRKRTLNLATFIDVLVMLMWGCAGLYNSYLLLVLGSVLSGFAYSLYSGTEEALLYETMVELRKENKYHEAMGKTKSVGQVAMAISALAGASIAYKYSYTSVVLLTVIPMMACFLVSLFLVEPRIHKEECKDSFALGFKKALRSFKNNKKLRLLSIAKIIRYSSAGTSFSFEATFFEMLIPVWLIGVVRFIKQIGGAVSFWFASRVINKFGFLKVLVSTIIASNFVKVIALVVNSAISPFMMSLLNLFYGLSTTSQDTLIQNEFSDKQRATMGSIVSLFGNILRGFLSIAIGVIADNYSVRVALFVLVVIDVSTSIIYKRALKKKFTHTS